MAGIINDGDGPKALWPAVKLWYEAAYDPEKQKELREILERSRKPLTRWQKIKRFFAFREIRWRIAVAYSVLRHGEDSPHIDIQY